MKKIEEKKVEEEVEKKLRKIGKSWQKIDKNVGR